MSSPPIGANFFHAGGAFLADSSPIVVNNLERDLSAPHTTGEYPLRFQQGIDAAECLCVVTPRTTKAPSGLAWTVVHASDTIKTVVFADGAGNAIDRDFDFVCLRIKVGA